MKPFQAIVATGIALFALQAQAQQVTLELHGTVSYTQLNGQGNVDLGLIKPGSAIDYRLTFNSSLWPYPGSTGGDYLNSVVGYSATVGGYSYGGQTSRIVFRDSIQNGAPNGALSDLLSIRQDRDSPYVTGRNDFAYNSGALGGYPLQQASIYSDNSPDWFAGVDLTATPFLALQASQALLSNLSFNMYFLPASTGQVNALVLGSFSSITVSAVPEPGTGLLLVAGACGVALLTSRRRVVQQHNG